MRSRLRYLIAGAVAGSLLLPCVAHAGPNDLDRSFGTGGVVLDTVVLAGLGEEGTGLIDLAVLTDGRIAIRAGRRCAMGCRSLVVARYSPTGVPAGTTGHLAVDDDENVNESLVGSTVAPDGSVRLVYAGWERSGARTHPRIWNISPDGRSSSSLPMETAVIPAAFEAAGGILGVVRPQPRLVRVNPDGFLDRSFGTGGTVPIPDVLTSTAGVAAGATIRIAGASRGGVALVRISKGGAVLSPPVRVPVPGWHGGILGAHVGQTIWGAQAAIGPPRARPGTLVVGRAGHTVVTGSVPRRDTRGVLVRRGAVVAFHPDGSVNRSFGTRGLMLLPQGDLTAAVQRNGKVVVAGTAVTIGPATGPAPLIVRRFNVDGSPDPSFRPTRMPVEYATSAVSVGLDGEGRIVVAAEARGDDGDSGLLLARLRGGEAPALRVSSPKRLHAHALRVAATSSVAGRARITVRQSGRVVGTRDVRFARGSRKVVTVPLRGATATRPLAVSGSLKGAKATGVTKVRATR